MGLKSRGIKGLIQFLMSLPIAIFKTIKLFLKYKPLGVIGVGGYVTAFPVLAAWITRTPSWIHEAELKPGMANKFLSYFATRVSTAFESCELPKSAVRIFTGHPVREGLERAKIMSISNNFHPKKILITGGSQGAQSLDDASLKIAAFCQLHSLEVYHQCRPQNEASVMENYNLLTNSKVSPFIDDMIEAYKWADIIVSRSGAGTVSELAVINKPVIFVPFPFAQGDHQTKNAMTLVEQGKALLVPEGQRFQEQLLSALEYITQSDSYVKMVNASAINRNRNGADEIASGVLSIILP